MIGQNTQIIVYHNFSVISDSSCDSAVDLVKIHSTIHPFYN